MTLVEFLDRRISALKGEQYRVDPDIPRSAVAAVVLSRVVMKLRGKLLFPRRPHAPFIGSRTTIRSRSRLRFGRGVTVGHGVVIDALSRDGVILGDNVAVGRNTRIEATGQLQKLGRGLRVGANVGLGTDCFYGCAGGIEIGADTIVGNWVGFHSENHVTVRTDVPVRLQGVTHVGIVVGRDCWIGAKVTVLDGARIGDGCVIAAGAVVVAGEYPGPAVYGGVPARRIGAR